MNLFPLTASFSTPFISDAARACERLDSRARHLEALRGHQLEIDTRGREDQRRSSADLCVLVRRMMETSVYTEYQGPITKS